MNTTQSTTYSFDGITASCDSVLSNLTPSQRRKVRFIVSRWEENIRESNPVIHTVEIRSTSYSTIWLYVEEKRTDCEEYSPRMLYSKERVSYTIGKRGKTKIHSSDRFYGGDQAAISKHMQYLAVIFRAELAK